MMRKLFAVIALASVALSCDGPTDPPLPAEVVSITITPADTVVDIVHGMIPFSVEVEVRNGASKEFSCSNDVQAGGNMMGASSSSPPQFDPPDTPGTYTVTCVAEADSEKSATATVRVVKKDLIAFWRMTGREYIFTMSSDGKEERQVTSDTWQDIFPDWSPDGRKIAFTRNNELRTCSTGRSAIMITMADGTGLSRVTPCSMASHNPRFSPDGNTLIFRFHDETEAGIATIGTDGSEFRKLTAADGTGIDSHPTWSPDGTKIAFARKNAGASDIYVMNADGTNLVNLTNTPEWNAVPAWSPDGTKIAFARAPIDWPREGTFQVWVMNADGSNPVKVTDDPVGAVDPAWSSNGTRIVYAGGCCNVETMDIWVVNADGTGAANFTNSPGFPERNPAWRR